MAKKDEQPQQTDYYQDAIKMRDRLNQISPSFCLAKWLQVSLHLTTGRTHSCYHPPSHPVPLDELKKDPGALHNTQHKMEQRKLMKDGQRPAECRYCWAVEDLGEEHISDRHYRSAEDWASERFDEVVKAKWNEKITPSYLEVNFNHACQLSCSYCGPGNSSSWLAEIKRMGPYPTQYGHNRLDWYEKNNLLPIPHDEYNPYVEAFWKWWPEVFPKLKWFRMTGGEPLIDPNTFRVFDYVLQHGNPNLNLSITSNMCPPQDRFDLFLSQVQKMTEQKKIKKFHLYASLDAVGSRAEYIRYGLNFKKFDQNIRAFLKAVPESPVSFIFTFGALSAVGHSEFLQYVHDLRSEFSKSYQRIQFDTPMLNSPEFMNLRVLTSDFHQLMETHIQFMESLMSTNLPELTRFQNFELAKLKRVLEWMKAPQEEEWLHRRRHDFLKFFQEHDKRRNLNLLKTFPEFQKFIEECKKSEKVTQTFYKQ